MSKEIKPNWKFIMHPGHPHASRLFYKGELVGSIRGFEISIDADEPIPHIKFDVFVQDVEITTDLTDPT